ncbi:ATP-binding cassette domain-containing protein [Alkaliphilus pronyensis]|uniref:ATP-binding cassette domain-containing protein n=1 Tax=Alkaliphilus pronyensis TaxID=1482732 RepID=UPI001865814D|nr:ATP-binding cassette domain-containing protein [Alkaliphilus pronyensis]
MIKLNNITVVQNGVVLLENINLTIEKGSWINITDISSHQYLILLKLLEGRLAPTIGEYIFDGAQVKEFSKLQRASLRKREALNLAEDSFLNMEKTVIENIRLQLKASGIYPTKFKAIINNILNELALSHIKGNKCSNLKSNEIIQVKLAKAIASSPKLIMLNTDLIRDINVKEEVNINNIIKNSIIEKDISILTSNYNYMEKSSLIKNIKLV